MPHPPPSPPPCRLLAGPAGAAAQAALAVAALAALFFKRVREPPPVRPLGVWGADVSKQLLGAAAAHTAGLLVALGVAGAGSGGSGGGGTGPAAGPGGGWRPASECGWYAVAFSVDTLVGTGLAVYLHRAAVRAAGRRAGVSAGGGGGGGGPSTTTFLEAVARCGEYGRPGPRLALFVPQALEWVACVLAARACCAALVWAFRVPLSRAASAVDALFAGGARSADAELAAVMVTGPLALNIAQALVQDAVLVGRRRWRQGQGGGGGGGAAASPRAALSLSVPSPAPSSSSPRPSGDMEALLAPLPPDGKVIVSSGRG
jgi:hypothetical protein